MNSREELSIRPMSAKVDVRVQRQWNISELSIHMAPTHLDPQKCLQIFIVKSLMGQKSKARVQSQAVIGLQMCVLVQVCFNCFRYRQRLTHAMR